MNGYFLVEAIEEALAIFDARRRILQPSLLAPSISLAVSPSLPESATDSPPARKGSQKKSPKMIGLMISYSLWCLV